MTQPRPSASGDDEVFEVGQILEVREGSSEREFLVRWAGYDSSWDTWEPRSGLADATAMVKKFEDSASPAKRGRPRSKSKSKSKSPTKKLSKSKSPTKKASKSKSPKRARSRSRARSKTPQKSKTPAKAAAKAKTPKSKSSEKSKIPKPATPASRSPSRKRRSAMPALPTPSQLRSRISATMASSPADNTRLAAKTPLPLRAMGVNSRTRQKAVVWADRLRPVLAALLVALLLVLAYYNRDALTQRLAKLFPKRR